jgi:hypothetical protein
VTGDHIDGNGEVLRKCGAETRRPGRPGKASEDSICWVGVCLRAPTHKVSDTSYGHLIRQFIARAPGDASGVGRCSRVGANPR